MLKCISGHFGPVFVFGFGLLACSKQDSTSLEVFRIPEPKWVTSTAELPFDSANQTLTEHSLNDRLDFSTSPGAVLQVSARCSGPDHVWISNLNFHIPDTIKLYSMIPRETLAPSLVPKGVRCSLDFLAINAAGARDRFRMGETKISDFTSGDGISLRPESALVKEEDLDNIRVESDADSLLLRCDSFEVARASTRRSDIWMSDFELSNVAARAEHPLQGCRVLALKDGAVRFLSAPFSMRLHGVLPSFTYHPARGLVHDTPIPHDFVFLTFEAKNNQSVPLRFELKAPDVSRLRVFDVGFAPQYRGDELSCQGRAVTITAPILSLKPLSGGATITPTPAGFRVELPPGSEAQGQINIARMSSPYSYGYTFSFGTYILTTEKPFDIDLYQSNEKSEWQLTETQAWGDFGVAWFTNPTPQVGVQNSFHWNDKTRLECQ